jgi:hypothetical protein
MAADPGASTEGPSAYGHTERSEPLAGVSRRPGAGPDIDPQADKARVTTSSRPSFWEHLRPFDIDSTGGVMRH